MANIKISELEELTEISNDDIIPIVDVSAGETKKMKYKSISGSDDVPINTIVEYDGTTVPDGWEEVEEKSYIQASLSADLITSESDYRLVFDVFDTKGSLFVKEDDGSISIKAGAKSGKLKIHYHSNVVNSTAAVKETAVWMSLWKNGNETMIANGSVIPDNSRTLLVGEAIIDYEAGDNFYIQLNSQTLSVKYMAKYFRTLLIMEEL